MPVFETNGKKWNVPEERLKDFAQQYPDAYTVEERDGKRYRVDVGDYQRFIDSFSQKPETNSTNEIDDALFEENQKRFQAGEPIQRVSTQSMIDANPELNLQDDTQGFNKEVPQSEIERLKGEGFVVLNEVPKKGADNKLVAFLHPKSSNGVLIELCQEIN